MKLYLSNLINRLKEYSTDLDKIEVFVDIPWVIVDDNLNQQKYIFKRNGDLVMSLNGQVIIGKWELLSAAKSLLIDRIQDKILLNQNFIDSSVMVLKKDGFKEENLILANVNLLPDLNVVEYLKQLYYEKNRIAAKPLKGGVILEIYNYRNLNETDIRVAIESESVPDGKYESADSIRRYLVKNSCVIEEYELKTFGSNRGEIVIEMRCMHKSHYYDGFPRIGNLVFQNNLPAPDGKYRLNGYIQSLWVKSGKIIKLPFIFI